VPIKIYTTSDMEGAIRSMSQRNDLSIVFMKHWCKRRIPLLEEKVLDIPSITIDPKAEGWRYILERWRQRRCLLYYKYREYPDWRPRGDAMLFVETPITYDFFEWITRGILREVIIYRPPDWAMQEEILSIKNPVSEHYRMVLEIARNFRIKSRNVREEIALRLSGFPPVETAVFTRNDLSEICGLPLQEIKTILTKGARKAHCWFQPLRLNSPPIDEGLTKGYRYLEQYKDWGDGLRMIRAGARGVHNLVIHKLIECGSITYWPPVHVLWDGWKPLSVTKIDIEQNVKMAEWYKMRQIIEGAEEYGKG